MYDESAFTPDAVHCMCLDTVQGLRKDCLCIGYRHNAGGNMQIKVRVELRTRVVRGGYSGYMQRRRNRKAIQ